MLVTRSEVPNLEDYYAFRESMVYIRNTFCKNSSAIFHNESTGKAVEINADDPFFDVVAIYSKAASLRQSNTPNLPSLQIMASIISGWIQWQQLLFDDENHSVFRLAQKSKLGRYVVPAVLEGLLIELSEIALTGLNYDPDLILQYATRFEILVKKLKRFYANEINSAPKNILITLNVLKFEIYLCASSAHIRNQHYAAAELYANKSFSHIGKLCPTERGLLSCFLISNLAYIKIQQHDTESAILYLKNLLDEIAKLKDKSSLRNINNYHLSKVCEHLAEHFLSLNQVDKAIKCLLIGMEYESSFVEIARLKKKLESLEPLLTSHLFDQIQTKKFSYSCRAWPQHRLICFYFDDEKTLSTTKHVLRKADIDIRELKKDAKQTKEGFAVEIDFNFADQAERFMKTLDTAERLTQKAKLNITTIEKNITPSVPINNNNNNNNNTTTHDYIRHPKTSQKKVKKKAAAAVPSTATPKQPYCFLQERRQAPLKVVEFTKTGKIFDPANPTGVVTLRVANMSGNWFACINPNLAKELPDNMELAKVMNRFTTEVEVGNDCCVPCGPEMKLKEKNLGGNFPYLFKIRLLGKGNGDIRLYAKLIEVTTDGKSLVAFTALNTKAHAKDTRPVEVAMPDESSTCKKSTMNQ